MDKIIIIITTILIIIMIIKKVAGEEEVYLSNSVEIYIITTAKIRRKLQCRKLKNYFNRTLLKYEFNNIITLIIINYIKRLLFNWNLLAINELYPCISRCATDTDHYGRVST